MTSVALPLEPATYSSAFLNAGDGYLYLLPQHLWAAGYEMTYSITIDLLGHYAVEADVTFDCNAGHFLSPGDVDFDASGAGSFLGGAFMMSTTSAGDFGTIGIPLNGSSAGGFLE